MERKRRRGKLQDDLRSWRIKKKKKLLHGEIKASSPSGERKNPRRSKTVRPRRVSNPTRLFHRQLLACAEAICCDNFPCPRRNEGIPPMHPITRVLLQPRAQSSQQFSSRPCLLSVRSSSEAMRWWWWWWWDVAAGGWCCCSVPENRQSFFPPKLRLYLLPHAGVHLRNKSKWMHAVTPWCLEQSTAEPSGQWTNSWYQRRRLTPFMDCSTAAMWCHLGCV